MSALDELCAVAASFHARGLAFGSTGNVSVRCDDRVVSEIPLSVDIPPSTRDHFLVDQVMPRLLSQSHQLVLHSGIDAA